MHHKRGRARRSRAGCKLCKPWKMNGWNRESLCAEAFGDHVRRRFAGEAVKAARMGCYEG